MEEVLWQEPSGMPLEWKLVQVVGMESPLQPTPQMLAIDPDVKPMHANGLKGWAVAWVPTEETYLIETFSGLAICVGAANLEEFIPVSVAQGGFDLAFPADSMPLEPFVDAMAHKLGAQHFCVVQFSSSEAQGREALKKAKNPEREWSCMAPEFETMFMGRKPQGKVSWLADESYDWTEGPIDSVSQADMMMEEITLALAPYCADFGFEAAGKSNGMLRMPFLPTDEGVLFAEGGSMTGDDFKSFADFTRRGKISIIYFLHGSGGTLTLEPKDTSKPSSEILVEEGQMVLFDLELMNFSYSPHGKDAVLLQSWILREAFSGEAGAEGAGELRRFDTSGTPVALKIGNSGETVDCMAAATRFLANNWSPTDTHTCFTLGTDGMCAVSSKRWDHATYYDPEGNGKAYVNHIGMCCAGVDVFTTFDHEFWGMTEKDTWTWNPCPRVALEVAFEACVRVGFTKESLRNQEFAMAMGSANAVDYFFHDPTMIHKSDVFLYSQSAAQYAAFMYYQMSLLGPNFVIETACSSGLYATAIMHTFLRPQEPGKPRYQGTRQVKNGLAGSVQCHFTPYYTMSLCAAGMITHKGRCFTFDASGDGFVRSEGCCFMQYQVHEKECVSRYAMIGGTAMNQDGRSASLTAPNGVSQQECIRLSLREAGIRALDIQIQELHGTGTALGDPIEVGALRNTMMQEGSLIRSHPLIKTSSKTNYGHMELVAGMGGILKCVLMGMWAMAHPGPHIRLLNSNIDAAGYPVMFASEAVDQGTNWGYFGVSSFGFSGCNARADIWAMATAGVRKALPIGWNLTASRHTTTSDYVISDVYSSEQLPSGTQENWFGTFSVGNSMSDWTQLHISGTWTAWADMEEPFAENDGVYEWAFRMGETMTEEFIIHVNQFSDYVICPATKQATSPKTLILGPGQAPKGYTWKVDGWKDGAKVGDVYVVKFWVNAAENTKHVSWQLADTKLAEELSLPLPKHRYYIWGSLNAWKLQEVEKVGDGYEASFRIGAYGVEEFQFCRDRNIQQLIYPTIATVSKTDVLIRGPNHLGMHKTWGVSGKPGEVVTTQLRFDAGRISVSISSSQGKLTWYSPENEAEAVQYALMFSDGSVTKMVPDEENPLLHRARVVTSSEHDVQWFRIIVDEDRGIAVHPEIDGALSGQSAAIGPDALSRKDCPRWRLDSQPDEVFIVTLDYTQADRKSLLTWSSES